jgi:hypothetical protein
LPTRRFQKKWNKLKNAPNRPKNKPSVLMTRWLKLVIINVAPTETPY